MRYLDTSRFMIAGLPTVYKHGLCLPGDERGSLHPSSKEDNLHTPKYLTHSSIDTEKNGISRTPGAVDQEKAVLQPPESWSF